jgi:hypothetical protein
MAKAQSPALREKRLARACDLANQDLDSVAIEDEWGQTQDRVEEPWTDAPARVSARTPFLRPQTGAGGFRDQVPSAYALGYFLTPLRG